ncbi:MAG: 3-phosphoshikimate 1-carboxyvinyltransferase [Alphaproteobacteria bacterium]
MSFLSCHPALSPLSGTVAIPGDKSLSHRALMFAALAQGETTITGLLPSEDVWATRMALASLGVDFRDHPDGTVSVKSPGYQQFHEPEDIWNMGNSGTSARLLMGMVCNLPFRVFMTGDASLRRRPMGRLVQPLSQFGANITARQDKNLPLLIQGATHPVPITYTLPVPSAQVKSAILLAGLMCHGETTVIEPEPSRDHTERLFAYYQIPHRITQDPQRVRSITVTGFPEIHPRPLQVVADPSSAAFVMVAALLVPKSHVVMPKVGLNPLRTGLIDTLRDMGGDIQIHNQTVVSGEEVGDIVVRGSALHGVTVPAERAPRMIDEYPILSVAAAFAEGQTDMHGLSELRVKESNRLQAILDGLSAVGVRAESHGDSLTVYGQNTVSGGATIATHFDHRMAMSFFVMGLRTQSPIIIQGWESINTSFPTFLDCMRTIGVNFAITPEKSH